MLTGLKVRYKTKSPVTVLVFPRKYSQAVWLRCTRPPAAGPLLESCPARQSCPWICPLCGTAPGKLRAYAVCRTAGTSAQTAAGQRQRGRQNWNQLSEYEPEPYPFQTSVKLAHSVSISLLWERKLKSMTSIPQMAAISPYLNLTPK